MQKYTPQQRAEFYAKAFPKWPAPRADERWLDDTWFFGVDLGQEQTGLVSTWVLGNDYRTSARSANGKPFYGAYPPNYVSRITSMFPDAEDTLHLFAGSMPYSPAYARFGNMVDEPHGPDDKQGDALNLRCFYPPNRFDFVMSDPPYSPDDAKKYDMAYVSSQKVMAEIYEVTRPGAILVWLDTKWPMHSSAHWKTFGFISVIRSTNHRFRIATFFERM